MYKINFYIPTEIEDRLFSFAVIAARYQGTWLLCRHHARDTWEMPGGKREPDESIEETARRKLLEECGVEDVHLRAVAAYSIMEGTQTRYGMLYFTEITQLHARPQNSEIAENKTFVSLQSPFIIITS